MQILITHTSHSTDQHILRQFCLFFLCPFPPLFSFPSLLCFSHLPFFNFHLPLLSSASHPVFPSFSLPLLSLSLSGVFTLLLLLFFYSYTFSAVTLSLIENALLQSFSIPAGNTHTHTYTHTDHGAGLRRGFSIPVFTWEQSVSSLGLFPFGPFFPVGASSWQNINTNIWTTCTHTAAGCKSAGAVRSAVLWQRRVSVRREAAVVPLCATARHRNWPVLRARVKTLGGS